MVNVHGSAIVVLLGGPHCYICSGREGEGEREREGERVEERERVREI